MSTVQKMLFLGTNDLNKIKTQRKCAKHLKFLCEGPIIIKTISTRARKLLVKILVFKNTNISTSFH